MRRTLLGLGLGLLLPLAVAAEPPSVRIETIRWPEIDVRSGPSLDFPATGTLRKGAQVYVRNKPPVNAVVPAKAFLEILPPPGSVSWVPKAVVVKVGNEVNGRQAFYVAGDANDKPVPIHPGGKSIGDGPLKVDPQYQGKVEAKRGTQGYLRGKAVPASWESREWYPIDPLPGESRFIPADAIQEPPPNAAIAARPGAFGATGQLTSMPRDAKDLFRKAQQADQAGAIDEAIRLYQQVAREVSTTNDSLANYCATRVYELRQRRRVPAPGTLTSRGGDPKAPGEPPLPGTSTFQPPPSAAPPPANLGATGAGFLRRTGFTIENRSAYALIDRDRQVMYYVTPEPGVNLEPYVDRWVDLHGVPEVRGDVRGADYMRVVKIFLLR